MRGLYRGKDVDDMTKDELIAALQNVSSLYTNELKRREQEAERDDDMLNDLIDPHG